MQKRYDVKNYRQKSKKKDNLAYFPLVEYFRVKRRHIYNVYQSHTRKSEHALIIILIIIHFKILGGREKKNQDIKFCLDQHSSSKLSFFTKSERELLRTRRSRAGAEATDPAEE